MVARVQKTGDQFTVTLPPQAVEQLGLADGDVVEISKPSSREARYASVEEALEVFERTLPRHEATYRELAK